jgi:hypothetical protein
MEDSTSDKPSDESASTLSCSKGIMKTDLRPHPWAECFPMIPDSELQKLADDIKANGLRQNIVVYEGQILDGRNRYAACQIAGIPIENVTIEYEGFDPVGYVVSAKLIRRQLEVGARAMITAELATATVGGDHSMNSMNGVSVDQVAKQMKVGTTLVTTARAIKKADPEVAADVKAGRISLNQGAKRSGVSKKAKTAKNSSPKSADSSEVPVTKAKNANTSDAEGKEAPVVDATSKEEKLQRSFWEWVESHDADNGLAIKVALQQIFAQMDLGDLAIADALKQIVAVMDLEDLKEMVAIKELEEADTRTDAGVPTAPGSEMEATSSELQKADNISPALNVETPFTTQEPPKKNRR